MALMYSKDKDMENVMPKSLETLKQCLVTLQFNDC